MSISRVNPNAIEPAARLLVDGFREHWPDACFEFDAQGLILDDGG